MKILSKIEGNIYLILYMACVPLANWMIGHIGTFCVPDGPCVIPVAPGITAPSGVLIIGAALVLRDLVQRRMGKMWSLGAIVAGTILSAFIAPPSLVIASTVAFLLSELADFAVYTPLQKRNLSLAVFVSSSVGAVVDSIIFLHLAFGSLEFVEGQIIGKILMALIATVVISIVRNYQHPNFRVQS
jgi:uncharacterized PurR-regulated membrane protein YhhQ (DUF165 family)